MNYLELIKKNSALSVFSFFFIIVFFSLGVWQVYKGNLKAQEEKEFYAYKPSIPYSQSLQAWSNVSIEGRFDSSRQILFDNQLLDGKPGYKVYTPFIFSDDRLIMVNRGWLSKADMSQLSPILDVTSKSKTITGIIYRPERNITFGDNLITESWPKISQLRDTNFYSKQYSESVENFFLHLDANHREVLTFQEIVPFTISSTRHFGYAFQWFVMTIVLAAMYFFTINRNENE